VPNSCYSATPNLFVYRGDVVKYVSRMADKFNIGAPPVTVHLRRSARAKRYSLRVSGVDGRVSLTMPVRASEKGALRFARQKEAWLRKTLENQPAIERPRFGDLFALEGREYILSPSDNRTISLTAENLKIPGPQADLAPRLRGFLKVRARDKLAQASTKYASIVGKKVTCITLRDTRSRWGSCTANGRLMFSWRLIMAPPEVLEYVAAHEVAHLVELNHAPEFWCVVAELMPAYQQHRAWLREHGQTLHRFRLDGS